jgi:hypothetical protein
VSAELMVNGTSCSVIAMVEKVNWNRHYKDHLDWDGSVLERHYSPTQICTMDALESVSGIRISNLPCAGFEPKFPQFVRITVELIDPAHSPREGGE